MSEERRAESKPLLFGGSTVLFGLAIGLLPAWDATHHVARLILGAIAVVVALAAFLRIQGRWRWPVLVGGVLFVVLYASLTGASQLMERSRQVDRLRSCETGALPSGVTPVAVSTAMEGPHLKSGEPCVQRDEARDEHRKWEPGGGLDDGFRQVIVRFPGDEWRLIGGPMLALFIIAFSGILLAKAADPMRE